MAKSVANIVRRRIVRRFGMNKRLAYVGCDDGSTYVLARSEGGKWRVRRRIDRGGTVSAPPSRIPAAVERQAWALRTFADERTAARKAVVSA